MTTRRAAGIWTFALGVVVAACVVVFTSDHVENPAATAVFACAAGIAFVTAGLIAWVRRPRNGSGKLMTLVGLTSFFGVLASGAIAVNVNESLRPRQIEHILNHSAARVLLTAPAMLEPKALPVTSSVRAS